MTSQDGLLLSPLLSSPLLCMLASLFNTVTINGPYMIAKAPNHTVP